MGNRFEIYSWKYIVSYKSQYDWELLWRGESFIIAIYKLIQQKTKRNAERCIKLEWRSI